MSKRDVPCSKAVNAPYIPPSENDVRRVWSLFLWDYCSVCYKEFRREWGWKMYVNDYDREGEHYICKECASTRKLAFDIFQRGYK
jgi:hypothetical protein